ncbi:hypothetical protein NKI04_26460 [Mesorhizobium sp. M0814]|uniref:hypothetical protein n=1 Tax=Mesorhizobium sp. M0814 TaxID=2957004 RepID=UPI003334E0AD
MESEIQAAVASLTKADTRRLYADLGAYSRAYAADPTVFASPSARVSIDAEVAGPLDDAIQLGERILRHWNKVLFDLVCGTKEADPEARKVIMSALRLNSPEAMAAAVTGILISVFSVGPAIAAVVGVLFGKVLMPAAGEDLCSFWGERVRR